MSISLRKQLKQIEQLNEVVYHAPVFDKTYYDKMYHVEGRKSGARMFYDFYAMEFLWSFLGSGQIPKGDRERLAGLPEDDPRRDIILGRGHKFLPTSAVKTIDSVYEQVTNAVAKNLLAYIRMAVVQEFQYLVSISYGWKSFRNALVTVYNDKKTISKEDFTALIKKHIPKMEPYPDVVKRLLKFSKYYSPMYTSDDKDPFNVSRNASTKEKEKQDEPYVEFPNGPTPEEPKTPDEPDDTDYNAEPSKREFGKYGDPGQPESPYPTDWSGMSSFKDVGELPDVTSGDEDEKGEGDEDEKGEGDEVKEYLKEEAINTDKIQAVYGAMNKSGLTMDDIEKAYNNISWGSSYGGPRWGAGALALLKLQNAKKNLSTEEMNHIIDHIYDLQHNTGSLLNKGPMYVDDTDLNRRYKITNVARFIPFVSPLIKDLILRYQRFLYDDPKKAETEANVEKFLNSPTLPIDPEDIKKLMPLGFEIGDDNSYKVKINFNNKKGESVYGVYYKISKHNIGEGTPPLFIVSDNLKADVKVYSTFEEAYNYLLGHKDQMVTSPVSIGSSYSSIKSDKQIFIDNHQRIKLPPDKEQALLNINIGYRKTKYYKAYFPGNKRLHLYAFSDGKYLIAYNDTNTFYTSGKWEHAFNIANNLAQGSLSYPDKADAQVSINVALGISTPSAPVTTPPVPSPKPTPIPTPAVSPGGSSPTKHPHSPSKASYSVHIGIKGSPNTTIRLTKEDEQKLSSIGFEPKVIGGQIWYIHKFVGDTVKFFPNNTAKILFASPAAGKTFPGVNLHIEKALQWLPANYNYDTTVSPIMSPSSAPGTFQASPETGIKAGIMFEKTIMNAGFKWDDMGKEYVDYPTNTPGEPTNILKIYPNRASKLTFASGQEGQLEKTFKDLASLVAYLKKEYPTQKSSLVTPTPISPNKLSPKEESEIKNIISSIKGFKI